MKYCITKWCKSITDDGKDKYINKDVDKSNMKYKFRILDDDKIVYGYGVSEKKSFRPLDRYMYSLGVTEIQYQDPVTKKYKTL